MEEGYGFLRPAHTLSFQNETQAGGGGKGTDFIFEGEFHAPTQTKVNPGESGGNGVASQVGRQDVPLHVPRPHRPTVNDSLWMMN